MVTSAVLYHVAHFLNVTIDIRNVCVFLAPLFSSLTAITTYFLTKELKVCTCYFVEICVFASKDSVMVLSENFKVFKCGLI